MSDETLVIQEALPAEAPPAFAPGEKRLRWFELSLVLLVAFSGYILAGFYSLKGIQFTSNFVQVSPYAYGILQDAVSLLLLGYVLARRKLRFRDIGLRWSWRDIPRGMAVTLAAYAAYYAVYPVIYWIEHALSLSPSNSHALHHPIPWIFDLPLFLLNPFFEELIVRAYLMTEVRELTGSPMLAVLLSIALQASYHFYYGWRIVFSLSAEFLVFSIYYARTRRITPVIFAHEAFDLYGFFSLSL